MEQMPAIEKQMREVESVMLYISEARERAAKAQKSLAKMKAKPHLAEALKRAEHELSETNRFLRQGTYFNGETWDDSDSETEQMSLP